MFSIKRNIVKYFAAIRSRLIDRVFGKFLNEHNWHSPSPGLLLLFSLTSRLFSVGAGWRGGDFHTGLNSEFCWRRTKHYNTLSTVGLHMLNATLSAPTKYITFESLILFPMHILNRNKRMLHIESPFLHSDLFFW